MPVWISAASVSTSICSTPRVRELAGARIAPLDLGELDDVGRRAEPRNLKGLHRDRSLRDVRRTTHDRSSLMTERVLNCVNSLSRRSRSDCCGGRFDQLRHLLWVRDHGDMARRNLDDGRAHSRGELSLRIGRERLVVLGDQIPGP
jgi:hypothetical protein